MGLREFYPFADELVVCHGLMYKAQRLLVPVAARIELLDRIQTSPIGINDCIRRAREAVFWPGMTRAIENTVSQCAICQQY
jgi:Integrase zinc binding domain